jgi:hypothetical protein
MNDRGDFLMCAFEEEFCGIVQHHAPFPPGPRQYACLTALQDTPGITSSELARRAFVSRQSMNVLLQGLEIAGSGATASP